MSKFKFTHFLKEFSICIIIITIILGAFILPLKNIVQTTQNDFEKTFIAPKSDTTPPIIVFLQNRPQNPEWYNDINITVEVYNRWGAQVFSSKGYTSEKRWDGTYKGKDVPIGTYYYVIRLNDGSKPITGHVTIVR